MKWIKLIKKLYTGCICRVLFAGAFCAEIIVLSGIKQGCPASGSIFAIAVDPLIRFILVEGSLRYARTLAYADELALVCYDFEVQLPAVLACLKRWSLATALGLNIA
eukprot:16175924-Heterocapsa_arctica.AAC.1